MKLGEPIDVEKYILFFVVEIAFLEMEISSDKELQTRSTKSHSINEIYIYIKAFKNLFLSKYRSSAGVQYIIEP